MIVAVALFPVPISAQDCMENYGADEVLELGCDGTVFDNEVSFSGPVVPPATPPSCSILPDIDEGQARFAILNLFDLDSDENRVPLGIAQFTASMTVEGGQACIVVVDPDRTDPSTQLCEPLDEPWGGAIGACGGITPCADSVSQRVPLDQSLKVGLTLEDIDRVGLLIYPSGNPSQIELSVECSNGCDLNLSADPNEICDNGIDDNCDDLIDENDPQCQGVRETPVGCRCQASTQSTSPMWGVLWVVLLARSRSNRWRNQSWSERR